MFCIGCSEEQFHGYTKIMGVYTLKQVNCMVCELDPQ